MVEKIRKVNLSSIEYLEEGVAVNWEIDFANGLYIHGVANMYFEDHFYEAEGCMHIGQFTESELAEYMEITEKIILNLIKQL